MNNINYNKKSLLFTFILILLFCVYCEITIKI